MGTVSQPVPKLAAWYVAQFDDEHKPELLKEREDIINPQAWGKANDQEKMVLVVFSALRHKKGTYKSLFGKDSATPPMKK